MSKFRIPKTEWLDLIKAIFSPCLQIIQTTVSKLVISSLHPKYCNIMGVGIFKIDLSSWIDCFSSLEMWTVTFWLLGNQVLEESFQRASTFFQRCCWEISVLSVNQSSSQQPGEAGQLCRYWLHSCLSGEAGDNQKCGRDCSEKKLVGLSPHMRCEMSKEMNAGGLIRQDEWEPAEQHLQTAVLILVFFTLVFFSFPVFTCHTHKGPWNAILTWLKGLEIWNYKRRQWLDTCGDDWRPSIAYFMLLRKL